MAKTQKEISTHSLIVLLKSFNEEEILGLSEYLNSAYYNTNKKLIFLFDAITHYYPDFNNKKFDKNYLWNALNTGRNISHNELRTYLSLLQNLIFNFLKIKNFEDDSFVGEIILLKELSTKNQIELFEKRSKKMSVAGSLKKEGNNVYKEKYLLETLCMNFINKNFTILKPSHLKSEISIVNECSINLTNYYITYLLQIYIKSYNTTKKFEDAEHNKLIENLMNLLNLDSLIKIYKENNIDCFILELYKKLIFMFKENGNIDNYYDYKEFIEKNLNRIDKAEMHFHFFNLISYCLHFKYSIEDSKLRNELFDLYQKFLKYEIFTDEESVYFNIDLFRNILMNALALKKIDWAENFIDNYIKYVNPKFQLNLHNYSYAVLYNKKANYGKSLEFALKVELETFIYKHDLNLLKLRNFYGMGEFEGLLDLIHSHKELLRADKLLPKDFYHRYMRFLFYLEKLVLNENSKTKLEFNLHKLEKEKFPYKTWLIEKYKEKLKL